MAGVQLQENEVILKDTVQRNLTMLKEDLEKQELGFERRQELFNEMAQVAHQLHLSLKKRGFEPIHHRYMIENRGMESDNPKFYHHIHPAEDLLAYIEDVEANKDPEDQTLNKTFSFKIYTRRWGHKDLYKLTRIQNGWGVSHLSYNGQSNKRGEPILFDALKHDSVNFPTDLGGYLEWLWDMAHEQGLSSEQVQKELEVLADWVSLCESNSPKGIFEGYK